jgi:flagellar biosynthesis/type III secretory pathway protein FliH
VLRGRRAPVGSAGGPGGSSSQGAPSTRSHGLAGSCSPGGLSPKLAAELRNLQRIADERGYAAGRARAVAELTDAVEAAGLLADRLEAIAPRDTTALAHAITELSLAIARRIVEGELQTDPGVLVRALENAMSSVNGSPEARVLLHPAAVETVRGAWENSHGTSYLGKRWIFEGDPSLPPGGCVLRYEHGFVDAGLGAQIEEIGIALDGAIPGFWRDHSHDAKGSG